MFNRSRGYKVVVKWFTLLGLQYSTAPKQLYFWWRVRPSALIWTNASGTEEHIHANSPAQWMINAYLEIVQGSPVCNCECIFLLCAIGHGSAVLLCSVGEILLLCSANLHNLVAQTSTFQLFKQHSIIAHFQRGSVAEEAEEGGRGGRD